jgi:hypothetical protein
MICPSSGTGWRVGVRFCQRVGWLKRSVGPAMGWRQDRVRSHLARAALKYGSAMHTSAWGQTLPIRAFWTMSGLFPVATELRTSRIGSFGPEAASAAFALNANRAAARAKGKLSNGLNERRVFN